MYARRLKARFEAACRAAPHRTLPPILAILWLVIGLTQPIPRVSAQGGLIDRPAIAPDNAAQVVELAALHGHAPGSSTAVMDMVFSADGKTLYSAGSDQTIRKWDVSSQALLDTLVLDTEPRVLALSPDGQSLAFGGPSRQIVSLNLDHWNQGQVLYEQDSAVTDLAYTPDGTRLISSGFDGTLRIWDFSTGKTTTLKAHSDVVEKIAISPDSLTLASVGDDQTVDLWNLQDLSGGPIGMHEASVKGLAIGSDGTLMITAGYDNIRLWNIQTKVQQGALMADHAVPTALALSPDSRIAAMSVLYPGNEIQLWDVQAKTKLATLQGHTDEIEAIVFSPDGRLLASCSSDDTIRLWGIQTQDEAAGGGGISHVSQGLRGSYTTVITAGNISKLAPVAALTGNTNEILTAAFSPDSLLIASGGADKTAWVWDITTGKLLYTLAGHTGDINDLAFSPDNQLLASASSDQTVKVWNMANGTEERTLYGYSREAYSVAFSPDGKLIAGGQDGGVYLWDAATGANVAAFETKPNSFDTYIVYDLDFSPDGSMLAAALNGYTADPPGMVVLWNVTTGQVVASAKHTAGVRSVAFSPDGKKLAIGTDDNLVFLWDVDTQAITQTMTGHTGPVWALAFSPDGTLLVSAGIGQVIVWDVAAGTPLAGPDGSFSAAFSADGTLIATGSGMQNNMQLWGLPEK